MQQKGTLWQNIFVVVIITADGVVASVQSNELNYVVGDEAWNHPDGPSTTAGNPWELRKNYTQSSHIAC